MRGGCRGHDRSITEKEGESWRKLEQVEVEVEVLIIFLTPVPRASSISNKLIAVPRTENGRRTKQGEN